MIPRTLVQLDEIEWEVLYLLVDALDQLRKLTLSFSELRYLAVEHPEADVRAAVESLLKRTSGGAGPGEPGLPLIVQVPNLANLPIYRITPAGRDLVQSRKAAAGGQGQWQGQVP
jgi:hypothetical protein